MVEQQKKEKRPPLGKEELYLRMQLAETEESLMELQGKMERTQDESKYEKMQEKCWVLEE